MNINGINKSNAVNLYKSNTVNKVEKGEKVVQKDRIELSEVAKLIKDYSVDINDCNNIEKINRIKNEISNGTYNINSELVAKSIIDNIKGSTIK